MSNSQPRKPASNQYIDFRGNIRTVAPRHRRTWTMAEIKAQQAEIARKNAFADARRSRVADWR